MKTELEDQKPAGLLTPSAPAPARAPSSDENWGDDEEKATGFKKWRTPLIVTLLGATVIFYAVKTLSQADGSNAKKDAIAVVQIALPPAPPPPPPPPPPPDQLKEEKMVEQEEEKEAEPEPEPATTTAIKGNAGGGIQIAAGRGNSFFTKRPEAGNKTKWGWYASQVQASISDALRRHPRTRKASMMIEVRIWADATGRITRAKLDRSTGDAALDAVIRDEALVGLQLQQPPPEGMPMPIVMRMSARRPN
jgi:TonB family protein